MSLPPAGPIRAADPAPKADWLVDYLEELRERLQ
jgi:hypothetical protein